MLGLTVVPAIQKEEGLLGYLYRLANVNALYGEEVLAAYRADAKSETQPDAPDHWRDEAEELRRPSTSPVRLWVHRAIRCCPSCLAEGAFWRASWHLSLYTCCARHKLELIDRCPSCNETLTHPAMSTLACDHCHSSLIEMHAVQSSAQTGALMVALELETRLLKHRKRRQTIGSQLSLVEFHEVALRLGIRGCPTSRTKPMKPANLGALRVARPIAEQAGQALRNWPHGFIRLLDSIRFGRNSEQTWRIARAMGPIYHDIYKGLPAPQFDFIRAAFEAYLRDHWQAPVALRNRNLSHELIENHRWVSREEATHALGIDSTLIDYLVDYGQIASRKHRYPSGRQGLVVDTDIQKPLLGRLQKAITLEEGARRLGIGKTQARQLVREGLLMTFGGTPQAGARWWVDPASFEKFDNTPLVSNSPQIGVMPVTHFARHLAMTEKQFAAFARAIVAGDLRAFSPGETPAPFGTWMLGEQDVRIWLKHTQPEGSGTSVPEAAKELGLKEEVAYALTRLGFLHTDTVLRGRRKTQTVSADSLRRFRREYVLAAELAHLLNADSRAVAKRLISAGIKPLAGPGIVGAECRQYVWKRAATKKLQRHQPTIVGAAGHLSVGAIGILITSTSELRNLNR